MELVDAYSFWANRVEIINQDYYIFIHHGKGNLVTFKWYITLNDDVIRTDVVDYISPPPP